MLKWLKKKFSKPLQKPTDPWDKAISVLDSLRPEQFNNVYQSHYTVEYLTVSYRTILEYTHALNEINRYMRMKSLLIVSVYQQDTLQQSISMFFTDRERLYIDPIKAIEEFKTAARETLSFMKSSDSSVIERNQAILNKVITNLISLIKQMEVIETG